MIVKNSFQALAINIGKTTGRTYLETSETQNCRFLDKTEQFISVKGRTLFEKTLRWRVESYKHILSFQVSSPIPFLQNKKCLA
jgi:hypothetical protein